MPTDDTPNQPSRLFDRLRERIRYKHYSIRTEQAYVHWTRISSAILIMPIEVS